MVEKRASHPYPTLQSWGKAKNNRYIFKYIFTQTDQYVIAFCPLMFLCRGELQSI